MLAAGLLAMGSGLAQDQGRGPGYGPGPGFGPGQGPGQGYGPGMMGGSGRGGPGMMGGYGGGYGPGPGAAISGLTDEQRDKLAVIREQHRQKNWGTMGQVQAEQFKLRQMYSADKLDSAAILEQQKKVDDLRRQMLKSRLEARKEIEAVLTPEQRKQLRQMGPWGQGGWDAE
jgi:Spy/CpxP family protein refolding chaperone